MFSAAKASERAGPNYRNRKWEAKALWESLMTSLLLSLIWSETVCDPVNSVHRQKRSLLKGVAMREWSSFRQTIMSFSDAALVTSIFMYYMI